MKKTVLLASAVGAIVLFATPNVAYAVPDEANTVQTDTIRTFNSYIVVERD